MITLTAPIKEIRYNRYTRDYDLYLNGEYVGSEGSYHAAEVELDRLAYEALNRAGIEPELLQTAGELDGGSDADAIAAEHNRDALARSAFWGSNPALMAELERRDGYEMGGQWHPANSMTLARCIELVATMTDAELSAALPIIGDPTRDVDKRFCERCDRVTVRRLVAKYGTFFCGSCSICACGNLAIYSGVTPCCQACHDAALAEMDNQPAGIDDLPLPNAIALALSDSGHNLVTPDPAECPNISAPQPVEDLPNAGARECERCGAPWYSFRDLRIQTDNDEITPVGVRLCDPCYRNGEKFEPIIDLNAFLAGPYAGEPGATDWAKPCDPATEALLSQPDAATCERYSTPPLAFVEPEPEPVPAWLNAPIEPARCANCDGPHHIRRCPEVWRALTG